VEQVARKRQRTRRDPRIFDTLDDAHDNVQVAFNLLLETRRANEPLVLIRWLTPLWFWLGIRPTVAAGSTRSSISWRSPPNRLASLQQHSLPLGSIGDEPHGPSRKATVQERDGQAGRPDGPRVGLLGWAAWEYGPGWPACA
jgi:hypothetical protein